MTTKFILKQSNRQLRRKYNSKTNISSEKKPPDACNEVEYKLKELKKRLTIASEKIIKAAKT